jgi:hypothetical protein
MYTTDVTASSSLVESVLKNVPGPERAGHFAAKPELIVFVEGIKYTFLLPSRRIYPFSTLPVLLSSTPDSPWV